MEGRAEVSSGACVCPKCGMPHTSFGASLACDGPGPSFSVDMPLRWHSHSTMCQMARDEWDAGRGATASGNVRYWLRSDGSWSIDAGPGIQLLAMGSGDGPDMELSAMAQIQDWRVANLLR